MMLYTPMRLNEEQKLFISVPVCDVIEFMNLEKTIRENNLGKLVRIFII